MNDKDSEIKLRKIMELAADSVDEMTDEEVDGELRALGKDPALVAKMVGNALLRGIAVHRKERFLEIEKLHDDELTRIHLQTRKVPNTPEERRSLLERILNVLPALRPMVLTHQYREFSHLTDEEIQRQLDQMAKLGVLDDPKLREGKA